ncbi:hypothetical protein TNCT_576251 [Trichonephila clavata]|uniref:Uncharacterized protein n=1 Tax=Trichonephila clavata TaxID=2740835 RepID=A0A8X6LQ73_TRICU|nr:hypothetical protein TNCT_576251 [Trichonephila clavata]
MLRASEDFKLPETVNEFRRYVGVINFYNRFIPNTAENQVILINYLKGTKSNVNNKIHWTEELRLYFSENSSESDIESGVTEDTPKKPAETSKKKVRFSPLPLHSSTRSTKGGREVRFFVRYR